jgi:hypothetical protein
VSSFTIDMLAAELKVSRRSIERCIVSGELVPVPGLVLTEHGGRREYRRRRQTFSAERVAELKERAETARQLGIKNIMRAVLSAGPVVRRPRYVPEPRLSPQAFIARLLWKRQNTFRRRIKTGTIGRPEQAPPCCAVAPAGQRTDC